MRSGAELVSENYLTQNKIYPLQLQTVTFLIANTRHASGAGTLVGMIGLWWGGRRMKSR